MNFIYEINRKVVIKVISVNILLKFNKIKIDFNLFDLDYSNFNCPTISFYFKNVNSFLT